MEKTVVQTNSRFGNEKVAFVVSQKTRLEEKVQTPDQKLQISRSVHDLLQPACDDADSHVINDDSAAALPLYSSDEHRRNLGSTILIRIA